MVGRSDREMAAKAAGPVCRPSTDSGVSPHRARPFRKGPPQDPIPLPFSERQPAEEPFSPVTGSGKVQEVTDGGERL